jgi:hypothetical protein
MESQGGGPRPTVEIEATRSQTPSVYVPRRFRVGGIEGIQTGAAIVGTPQGDGMIAIDVEWMGDAEPDPEVWSVWIAAAGRRHSAENEELREGERQETRLVSEAALIEVGRCVEGKVLIDEPAQQTQLSRWLEAGRADWVIGHLPPRAAGGSQPSSSRSRS